MNMFGRFYFNLITVKGIIGYILSCLKNKAFGNKERRISYFCRIFCCFVEKREVVNYFIDQKERKAI